MICAMVRYLAVDSGLSAKLWDEFMLTKAYKCNRLPKSVLQIETPHKILYGWKVDPVHLEIIEVEIKARYVVEARNVVFVGTPHLIPQSKRPSRL